MDIKKLVMDLIEKGMSDEQIVSKIKDHEELKSKSADQIFAVLAEAKRDADLSREFASRKAADLKEKSEKEIEAKASAVIEKKLKELKLNPFGGTQEVKSYNHRTGKYESQSKQNADSIEHFGKMLKYVMNDDKVSAAGVSRDIDIENAKDANRSDSAALGGYAVPTAVDNQIHELIYANSVALQNFNTDVIIQNSKIYPAMSNVTVGYIATQDTAAGLSTPAFTNPTATMQRVGGYSAISNKLVNAANADIVAAFTRSYAAAFARFVDLHVFCGNITNSSDLIDGIAFSAEVGTDTEIALSALGVDDLSTMLSNISDEASALKFFGNRKVLQQLGLDETTGGMPYFPQFVSGGQIAPFGVPFVLNTKIPNTLDVSADKRTTGTDTALFLADTQNVIIGVSPTTRIDTSTDLFFTKDQIVMRGIKEWGLAQLQGSGAISRVLALTA
jgi:HK97 family phage major capsid protein